MAANARVRVFLLRGTVYGCSLRTHNQFRLGIVKNCQTAARVGPVVVAGDEAAYGLERCGIDTGSTEVIVRRLTDGRQLRSEASIAGMLLTTETIVTDLPEKEKAPAMPPGGMGGMDY